MVVAISEEAVRQRNRRTLGEIHQIQTLHILTNSGTPLDKCIPEKTRSLYPGTSRGTVIAWVGLTPVGELWTASGSAKKEIYGPDKIIGALPPGTPERDLNAREPVFFNGLPESFWDDFAKTYSVRAFLDCTPGAGDTARAAINQRIPYWGVCF